MSQEAQQRADEVIRHQIDLERFKSGEASKMKKALAEVHADVVKRLDKLNAKILEGQSRAFYTKKRLERLSNGLASLIHKGYVDIHRTATLDNRDVVDHEIEWTADVILAPLDDVIVPTTQQVFASVEEEPFEGWIGQKRSPMTYANSSPLREVEAQYTKDMQRAMRSAYLSGSTVKEAEKLLIAINNNIARRRQDYNKALRNTEIETRTALQTYANRAMQTTLVENGVIWELYLATLDSRTTEICGNLDGTRWRLKDLRRPQIPQHWGCRSVYVPLFDKDEKLEGERPQITPGQDYKAGSNKTSTGKVRKARRGNKKLVRSQVSTDMNFNAWLSRQDRTNPQYVKDYFGSQKKYDAWKAGKLGKVKYTGIGGQEHSINSFRHQTLGEDLKGSPPPLNWRSTRPAEYFMDKGGSKRISKELDEFLEEQKKKD